MLDCEPLNDSLLITCGTGGMFIYDVSDDIPVMVSHFNRQGQMYNVRATGDLVFVAQRTWGGMILDLSDPENPLTTYSYNETGVLIEDGVLVGNHWWLAAHDNGLITLNLDDPTDQSQFFDDDLGDAWAIEPHPGSLLYIADGANGLAIVSIDDTPSAELIATIETSGSAIDVKWFENFLAVAVGNAGVDIFDISNPTDPEFLRNVNTPNFANHVSVSYGLIAVADWEQILIFNASSGEQIATKYTPGRAMGIYMDVYNIFVADWGAFRRYEYGTIIYSDIEVEPRYVDLSFVPENESYDTSIVIMNVGASPLRVSRISSSSPAYGRQPGVTPRQRLSRQLVKKRPKRRRRVLTNGQATRQAGTVSPGRLGSLAPRPHWQPHGCQLAA